MMKHFAPKRGMKAFTCPHCDVYARQYHHSVGHKDLGGDIEYSKEDWLASTICDHCGEATLWLKNKMLHPTRGSVPPPNPDMPPAVMSDYEEAASIATLSPKAAAALLRLAIQKLCACLGGKGKNINDDIALLVKKGLPEKIQQSLDIVRVVGNNAVHPGQIDVDDPEVVAHLFLLLNVIVETMISTPFQIENLYAGLPQGARNSIEKRDGKAKNVEQGTEMKKN
jgi:hypothetical protein